MVAGNSVRENVAPLVSTPVVMVWFSSFWMCGNFSEDCTGGAKKGLARSDERVIFSGGVNFFPGFEQGVHG
jgi:hypothetical protein